MTSAETGLHYTVLGSGDPVILLDWTPWETAALADALASRYRVISIEPPNSGQAGITASDTVKAVARVVETAGVSSFILAGASVGADVAFRLALQRPADVAALVLVSPTCIAPATPRLQPGPEMMLAHPENAAAHPPDPGRTAALVSLAERWRETEDSAADLLPGLLCATLAVFGQEDRLVSPEAGQTWKGQAPNCNVCYVYDAGHAIAVDRPDALVNVVMDFVERRETFVVENRSSLINP